MVVDGHRDTLEMFDHVLQATGAKVITAGSALRALATLRTVVPSVVMTNIEMPDIDGFSFIAAAREIPATRHVPMIAVTGVPLHRQRRDWKDAGFARALVKPVDPFMLCAMIVEVISEATAQASVGTITAPAIQRLQAAARASCEITRRLREDSREICEQASILRSKAAQVRVARRHRGLTPAA